LQHNLPDFNSIILGIDDMQEINAITAKGAQINGF
jgi:hypothetical protein